MILFVFMWKIFFQLVTFMYETKLKGHDGIAVYKSLHFLPNFIGNFPEVEEDANFLFRYIMMEHKIGCTYSILAYIVKS